MLITWTRFEKGEGKLICECNSVLMGYLGVGEKDGYVLQQSWRGQFCSDA